MGRAEGAEYMIAATWNVICIVFVPFVESIELKSTVFAGFYSEAWASIYTTSPLLLLHARFSIRYLFVFTVGILLLSVLCAYEIHCID